MILVTGATGFIGGALTHYLAKHGFEVAAVVRCFSAALPPHIQQISIGDQYPNVDWGRTLSGVDVVIHLAGRAHILSDTSVDPLTEFREINTGGTLNLAEQSAAAGVKRFIFISSIKVNGNETKDLPFTSDDQPNPAEPYAISKLEAEVGLRKIGERTCMEVVIIRPPLVYGPGAPGNFGLLMNAVARGAFLPLGSISNKRSLVALGNLIDFITVCIDHPRAANQTFLASDGEDLSTTELLQRLGLALGRRARVFPFPRGLLILGLGLVGKSAMARRLCGSLQVDIQKNRDLLGWSPPVSVDAALRETAQAYLVNCP